MRLSNVITEKMDNRQRDREREKEREREIEE